MEQKKEFYQLNIAKDQDFPQEDYRLLLLTESCCVSVTEAECSSGEEECSTQQDQDCRQTFKQVQIYTNISIF